MQHYLIEYKLKKIYWQNSVFEKDLSKLEGSTETQDPLLNTLYQSFSGTT